MKHIIPFLIVLIAASCSSDSTSADSENPTSEKMVKVKKAGIAINLNDLLKEYRITKNLVKANEKYNNKTLKIKGRTSGISEEGILTLQAKALGASVICSGLPKDLLKIIKKDDIVEISGTFNRKKGILGHLNFLKDCFSFKKLK
ncbi:MAG: hypothetical protein ACI9U0_000360 [Flavobacteriales bacterium]|jgi:hypothetical protein|tara:strand:+ start:5721 stop:6155 length:435 start_codon:yes stop_codon:yes gene_type:complete